MKGNLLLSALLLALCFFAGTELAAMYGFPESVLLYIGIIAVIVGFVVLRITRFIR